jgi:lysophospholipase L1-like esterase
MKYTLTTFFGIIIINITLMAQSPEKMSYQAVIRNGNDKLLVNQTVGIQISILMGSTNGTIVYSETYKTSTNASGLVSFEIGNGTVTKGNFANINWATGPYFIKNETDPTGGINYTITGISQLMSVPYALYSKTSENITGPINEADPLFKASVAAGITKTDTSNWNKSYLKHIGQDILMEKYCALGASTASMNWQAEVAKSIASNYKCYAIGGARWSHTDLTLIDYSKNASDNTYNKVISNELARLIKDNKETGYYPDLITIMCGLNDAASGIGILGNYEETFAVDMSKITIEDWFTNAKYKKIRETVYGSARFVIENIVRNFPKSQLIILSPQQCNNGSYNYENILATNLVVEKIANRYAVPVIDIFKESGITDAGGLITQYLREDGVHPNAAGEKLLTNLLIKRLRYLYFKKG